MFIIDYCESFHLFLSIFLEVNFVHFIDSASDAGSSVFNFPSHSLSIVQNHFSSQAHSSISSPRSTCFALLCGLSARNTYEFGRVRVFRPLMDTQPSEVLPFCDWITNMHKIPNTRNNKAFLPFIFRVIHLSVFRTALMC